VLEEFADCAVVLSVAAQFTRGVLNLLVELTTHPILLCPFLALQTALDRSGQCSKDGSKSGSEFRLCLLVVGVVSGVDLATSSLVIISAMVSSFE
jgi:hypothetical protein